MLPDGVADLLPASHQEVEYAVRQSGVTIDLVHPEAGPGRLLRRLVHDRVARDQGRRGHARRQREREVEGRDAGEYAVRAEHVGIALDRRDAAHGPNEPVGLLDLGAVIVDEVRRFFGVAHRLEPALADLEAHERCELVLLLPDQRRRALEHRDPLLPRRARPAGLSRAGGPHGAVHLCRPRRGEAAQQDAGVDGRAVLERLASSLHRLAADPAEMTAPRGRSNLLEAGVEPAMEILEVARGRRIGDLCAGGHRAAPMRSAAALSARVNRATISSICSSVTINGGANIARSPLMPSA